MMEMETVWVRVKEQQERGRVVVWCGLRGVEGYKPG